MSDLDWPDEFERTDPSERRPYPHNFEVSAAQAIQNVLEELERFDGAANVRIETESGRANDEVLSLLDDYEDPGFVAYWERGGEEYAAPCDKWDNLRDNAQAVYHYLKAKRGMERWGVETIEGEFSTQRREKRALDD